MSTLATDYRALHAAVASDGPDWLRRLRADGLARFETHGLPGPRDEAWRHTPVATIGGTVFRLPGTGPSGWDRARLAELPLTDLGGPRLVFVNGRLAPELSDDDPRLDSLAGGLATERNGLEAALVTGSHDTPRPFRDLNDAFFVDGARIRIPDGTEIVEPVHVLFVTDAPDDDIMTHPRCLIEVGAGARVTVVESYAGAGGATRSLTNAVTTIVVGENAHVRHVRVQRDGDAAFHVGDIDIRQARSSVVNSTVVSLGAALSRVDLRAVLEGEGADNGLDGLYVVDRDRHVDHHTVLDHAVPHCASNEVFTGILADRARAVFNGRIIVRQDAQKTDAKQSNPNLLLSDDALVHTRPQLEIYADDVRCTHGATVGQLADEAVFYLRSRGIGAADARDMLIHAFASDVLDRIPIESLRLGLEREMVRRLPGTTS